MKDNTKTNKKATIGIFEDAVRISVVFVILISVVIMAIAMLDKNTGAEAPLGEYGAFSFNYGWVLEYENGDTVTVNLPFEYNVNAYGRKTVIENVLPKDLSDGMNLVMRAAMEDVRIYVNGQLRAEYSAESFNGLGYYIPSAYVAIPLNAEDSSGKIRMEITAKRSGIINEVYYGHGEDAWNDVVISSIPVAVIAVVMLILGLFLIFSIILSRTTSVTGASIYLGLLMIDVALWMIAESRLRQLFFRRPSLSGIFSYLTVELISVLACLFFDEVQHRQYHRIYIADECVGLLILFVNAVLNFTGVCDFFKSLPASHLWSAVCAVELIIFLVLDIKGHRIGTYIHTAIGMLGFMAMSIVELVLFYVSRNHVFGAFMCIGLIILMFMTVIQTINDVSLDIDRREKARSQMTIKTIETIAGAIDARDEYTGGHSERVGFYAERLAREMAADYDLTEEDILRVHYVGLVHDIGKIGVADSVLNKSGRLSDEEFALMKKHSEIGYEIMSSMEDTIDGMLDGIRHHHERFDGKGYPDGLSDTDIPLIARILALADSYDAMTSNRVYRKRLTDEEVKNELLRCSGTQFDPALTGLFVNLIERGELSVRTADGVSLNENGQVLVSALLESRLQKDLLEGKRIRNPEHIRMLCYMIKLMEKKGEGYSVYLIRDRELEESGKGIELIRECCSPHDLCIRYGDDSVVLALYNIFGDDADRILSSVSQKLICPKIDHIKADENEPDGDNAAASDDQT